MSVTTTTAPPPFAPLAPGTNIATVGTFYPAEVVSSEVITHGITGKSVVRKSVIRWTKSIPAAGVYEGDEQVWVHIQGRPTNFFITAGN